MDINISKKEYSQILEQIQNKESPVGIDAGKTHVLILHKLSEIEQRLQVLEKQFFKEDE